MRLMGIEAIHPGGLIPASLIRAIKSIPIFSESGESLGLMRYGVFDITYIGLRHGWLYLVAIMDWMSRYVLILRAVYYPGG